ncbi:MAG: hypothetical protein NTW21_38715 [Verrucomicrobia bacterium]|nr:hypothetical protein [Verrucomicrobiota bacterium]
MIRALPILPFLVSLLGLSACGIPQAVRDSTADASRRLAAISIPGLFPERVKIAVVRQQDLQALPLGREQALAYEKRRQAGLWARCEPVDFQPPALPEPGAEMDGSLLPPLNPE